MTDRHRRGLAALAALMLSAAPLTLAGAASAATARPAPGRPAVPAAGPVEIGLDQTFTGVLNGQRGIDVLRTDCTGPGQTGHPLAGQTVEVDLLTGNQTGLTNLGFTGGGAFVIFTEPSWNTGGVSLPAFSDYFAPAPVPTSLTVPCSGTGTITFEPAPDGLIPAFPATMTVTFASRP